MPEPNGDAVDIPVIDISEANTNAAEELVNAAATYGFVFVQNNRAGVPPDEIANVFSLVNLNTVSISGVRASYISYSPKRSSSLP